MKKFASESEIRAALKEHEDNMEWLAVHSRSLYDWVEVNGQSSSANQVVSVSVITTVTAFVVAVLRY